MPQKSIRLASYNIRKTRGLDQRRLPERTLQVINELEADIVMLQEADMRMGVRKPAIPHHLIASETDFKLVDVSSNQISLGWHGNAVLVRDGIDVDEVKRIELPGLEPRGAVQLDLSIGDGISFVAVHLGLRRKDRQEQLKAICEATINAKHTVIAGDFNEWSSSKGLEPLNGRFNIHMPGKTFHSGRPMAALDRFALSAGITLKNIGVAQGDLAKRASDHLPIWAEIDVPAKATFAA